MIRHRLLRPVPLVLLSLLAACAAPRLPPPEAVTSLAGLRAGLGPDCIAAGAAVHIGRGRFVTAAHLVDGTQPLLHDCIAGAAPPWVRFQGEDRPAELLRAGQADLRAGPGTVYVDGRDIALLRVAGLPPDAPALGLCRTPPRPGLPVRLVTPRRLAESRVSGLMEETDTLHGGYAELPLRLEPGESGGAVIDPARNCLAGLVSHRTETRSRFVPASILRDFLGE